MRLSLQDAFAGFNLQGSLNLMQGALQRVLKHGPDALVDHKKADPQRSHSNLTSVHTMALRIGGEAAVRVKVDTEVERSVRHEGNTLHVSTLRNTTSATQVQSRQEIKQVSEQRVQGQVHGKAVFAHTSRELDQVSVASSATRAQETLKQHEAQTREVDKQTDTKGTTTRVETHIESAHERDRNQETEAARRTETQLRVATYDKAGQVVGEQISRQAVSTTHASSVDQSSTGSASRDITQTTKVVAEKEGNAAVRQTKTATEDVTARQQTIDTETRARSTTLVEKLDADGLVVSARASAQEVQTSESRSIDGTRAQSTEQVSKSKVAANATETQTKTSVEIHAATVDHTQSTTTVSNFNGAGALVSGSTTNRDVTVSTTEDRAAQSTVRSAVSKEGGVTTAVQEISGKEQAVVVSHTSSEVNGALSERTVRTEGELKTQAALENRLETDGSRTLEVAVEQVRRSEVEDLSVNAKGQARLVETQTVSKQKLEGEMSYDPATSEVGGVGSAPGYAMIQFGAMTGLRSSFKLDDGVLQFDFEAQMLSGTEQTVTTGQLVDTKRGTDVAGPDSTQQKASAESVRFKGQIVASRDASGNRVLDVDATVTREAAAIAAYEGKGIQAERSRTELNLDARLSIDRQTTAEGTTKTLSTGDLQVEKVERYEAAGNVPTLERLTSQDALRAGFSLNNGALQFNFGAFNLGISLFA